MKKLLLLVSIITFAFLSGCELSDEDRATFPEPEKIFLLNAYSESITSNSIKAYYFTASITTDSYKAEIKS